MQTPQVRIEQSTLHLSGDWVAGQTLPAADLTLVQECLRFDLSQVGQWDSALLAWLVKTTDQAQVPVDNSSLPESIGRLYHLATAVPEKDTGKKERERENIITKVGNTSLRLWNSTEEAVTFIGESTLALGRFMTGRACVRWRDFSAIMQNVGAEALPIVSLISFLVGLILAFVAAEQLRAFGASLYVANLVGVATVREMGAMMTAVIMCGRTGAAFAAQLGSMKTTEEIDALTTLGINPMDFLVLPRMLALCLMMPLLTFYANFVGIAGGFFVAMTLLDISFTQYLNQTIIAINLPNFFIGIVKSSVFGIIIAVTGCLRGMQCGNSSSAVGVAATSAVVTGITWIIIADAIFAVMLSVLGIG